MGYSTKLDRVLMVSTVLDCNSSSNHEESLNLRRNNFVFILLVVLLNLNVISDVIVHGSMHHMDMSHKDNKHTRNLLQKKRNHHGYDQDMKMQKIRSNRTEVGNHMFDNSSIQYIVNDHNLNDVSTDSNSFGKSNGRRHLSQLKDHLGFQQGDTPNHVGRNSDVISDEEININRVFDEGRHYKWVEETSQGIDTNVEEKLKMPDHRNFLIQSDEQNLQQIHNPSINLEKHFCRNNNQQSEPTLNHSPQHQQSDHPLNHSPQHSKFVTPVQEENSWKSYFWEKIVHRLRKSKRQSSRRLRFQDDKIRYHGHSQKHHESNKKHEIRKSGDQLRGSGDRRTEQSHRGDMEHGIGLSEEKILRSFGGSRTYSSHRSDIKQKMGRNKEHLTRNLRFLEDINAGDDHEALPQIESLNNTNFHNNLDPSKINYNLDLNFMQLFNNNFNQSAENKSDFSAKPRSATNSMVSLKKMGRFYEETSAYFQGDKPVWPVKKEAVLEGDLILGGLMMVHEREESITCGPIMPEGGVQALEAMLYTLDVLNARKDKKFTLGAHILDDCDKDTYGLEMAVDFIKGSISNIEDAEYHCNKTQVRKVISGVVGAASSVTSIQVANLLRLFKIPQVSFFSTSPELSNKQRFEYFTRTIPSDHHQVQAMVEIVRRLRWSYVSIIYEESNYGIKAFEELEVLLAKYDICIAVKEKLVKDSGVAEETSYDSIVLKLLTKPRAKGTIIFGSDQEVAGFMRAVRRCNATGAFSWIGSDGWSARSLVWQGQEAEVEGTLSVQPQANPVKGFDTYFLNLTVENNKRNPWFVEFWEDHFQCRYPNSSRTPYNQKYTRLCSTQERLSRETTRFENQLQFVSDAVMAFAVAFHDMHRELCGGKGAKRGLCDAMRPIKGPELLKYLRKVNFQGLSGDKFRFDPNGDGPARYNIIHFKQISAGNYSWIRVGEYIDGELRLDMDAIQFRLGHTRHPDSVCSFPCELGQAKKYVEGESCCWHCFNCSQYQVRHPLDETQCLSCPWGTIPDASKQQCLDIPEVFLRAESAWAICAMCLSITGILLTLFIIGVFIRHNDTPVVKAAGRELSYVLLTGILLCYLVTFVLVLRPSDIVCGVQRFGTGFCFTVVYAAILTKTNRISRIFNAGKRTAKRPSFITPKSQLIICSGFVSVQVVINGVWMLVSPPRAIHHYPTREENLLVCSSYVDASYMIAFGYPIVLIIICTVYAVLTRNIPEAFNESKHIGFTMYTTCVIWLAFVPLFFGTGSHMPLRITSMSVTISLSASVTIACLFSPKLYIILIRPERNVRQSMMPTSKYSGTVKSGTSASVMAAAVAVTNTQRLSQPFINAVDPSVASRCIDIELCSDETSFNRFSSIKIREPILVTRSTQTVAMMTTNEQSPSKMPTTNVKTALGNNNNNSLNGMAGNLNNARTVNGVSNVSGASNVINSAENVVGNMANVVSSTANVVSSAANVASNAVNVASNTTNVVNSAVNLASNTANVVSNLMNVVSNSTNVVTNTADVVTNGPLL